MKILHVSFSDAGGGAAIAAHRLVAAQRSLGLDARMLVIRKRSADPVVHAPLDAFGRLKVRAARFAARRVGKAGAPEAPDAMRTLGLFASGIGRAIKRENADIIHLHWLGGEMIALGEIAGLPQPVVWTCHDMWPFCGAEHYAAGRRFADGYPQQAGRDIDRWVFLRKRRLWEGWRPSLICPSRWMADQAAASVLMRDAPRFVIANTLNTDIYRPMPRDEARRGLGLPQDVRLVLFGAADGVADPRKGFDLLARSLAHLIASDLVDLQLATFGGATRGTSEIEGLKTYEFGAVHDPDQLAMLFSSADVFVAPSRIDNLPNTVLEAQACGVPCVAFDVGGMRDIIARSSHGALARPFDVVALASGIVDVIDHFGAEERNEIRNDAVRRFGEGAIAQQHFELYRTLAR